MNFNKEQFEALAPFERYFQTAVRSDYASYPGIVALRTIHEIFTAATKDTRLLKTGCGHCVLALLKDCGRLYFQDKETLAEADKELARRVEITDAPAEEKKAVPVKTKSGRISAVKTKDGKTPKKSKRAESARK